VGFDAVVIALVNFALLRCSPRTPSFFGRTAIATLWFGMTRRTSSWPRRALVH